jgi:membrane AbrB-like protein
MPPREPWLRFLWKPFTLLSPASAPNRAAIVRHVAETLAIAIVGGGVLGAVGFPAGWLSGAILAVAAAAIAGRPMLLPVWFTRAVYVLIGISLGAVVTPETLHGMATYPASIAVLIAAMGCIGFAGAAYLQLMHGWEKTAAYLAAAPGGMSQVLVLAADLGADMRGVAIVQSIRVVIVAVGLPAGLSLFGLAGHAARPGNGPFSLALVDEGAILVAAAAVGAAVAHRFKLPGGLLFGAMFASAALHGTGFVHAVVPPWVANTAMIALGAITGSRFTNTPPQLLLRYLGAGCGSFAVAVTIATIFASVLVVYFALPAAEVMIAFAPGSVDAMMLLALALHLDPVYVGAHHVMRIVLVSVALPFVARRVAGREASN